MSDKLSIGDIKTELKNITSSNKSDIDLFNSFIKAHENDERSGVKSLITSAVKKRDALEKEIARTDQMYVFEQKYISDYPLICGVDEVGRGPLAGPVCAAAVILKPDSQILFINDSKKLSAAKREELYDEIIEKSLAVGVAFVDNHRIDEINILNATYEAMRDTISKLSQKPDMLLVDAVTIPEVDIKQVSIVKGDAKSASIAAASIIAKVTRDKLMDELGLIYPEYGFESNKGYGTKAHYEAIAKYGELDIHRKTFL